ncbi:hypothetical protein J5N97_013488 [Dioscorea zingiberensis]|uniref:High chlorophyll fluorescence 153 n=1 Tax=Dioscorea zingiberensis TaxID=325984 RepID=A0A9D5CSB2_9LILI|nr:hypothetical protein J5N97_013488 [Dioscorea zingiberensis]
MVHRLRRYIAASEGGEAASAACRLWAVINSDGGLWLGGARFRQRDGDEKGGQRNRGEAAVGNVRRAGGNGGLVAAASTSGYLGWLLAALLMAGFLRVGGGALDDKADRERISRQPNIFQQNHQNNPCNEYQLPSAAMATRSLSSSTLLIPPSSAPKASKLHPYSIPSRPEIAFPSGRSLLQWLRRPLLPSDAVVVRAGPPSSSTLLGVFLLPLSLLIGTILVSIRIADNLDEKYLKELAMNEAMAQENEAESEDEEGEEDEDESADEGKVLEVEEMVAPAPRIRNRPKK